MKYLVLIFATFLFANCAWCTGPKGSITVLGAGTITCGSYVKDFKDQTRHSWEESWLSGYFSALNLSTPGTSDVVEGTDLAARSLWIKNYCSREPLQFLIDAANALVKEIAKRNDSAAVR